MPFVFKYSEAKRKAYGERLVGDAQEYLTRPDVVAALGEFGVELASLTNRLTVPDVVDGYLVPERLDDDSDMIPVVTVRKNEVIKSEAIGPTPSQRNNAESLLIANWRERGIDFTEDDVKRMERNFTRKSPYGEIVLRSFGVANESRAEALYGASADGRKHYMLGRPHLSVDWRTSLSATNHAAVMAHELTHVIDDISQPILTMDRKHTWQNHVLRSELGAYAVGAVVSRALGVKDEMTERVESIRQRHNGDMFADGWREPSDAIKRDLKLQGVNHIYDLFTK